MLKLAHRSYTNGEFFRPKPLIVERPESHLLVVATPWGGVEAAQRAAAVVVDQFELLAGQDATSPFELFPSVSSAANRLRSGVLLANQDLYRGENGKALKSAVEITALHFDRGVLSWVHVGGPHLLMDDGQTLHPLAYDAGITVPGSGGPLFSQALGIDNQVPLHVGSQRMNKKARLLLLAHSRVPRSILADPQGSLDQVVESLIRQEPEVPFWFGLAFPESA